MDNRIEPTQKGFSRYDLEETLRKERKKINFGISLYVGDIHRLYPYNSICTRFIGVYSQKGKGGLFIRDEDGRELHLQGKYTDWWPNNPFLLGGEEGIPEDSRVKYCGLPKLRGGIGINMQGETFEGPAETHEQSAIIIFSFIKNSKVKTLRTDRTYETKDPDDYH